MGRLDKDYDFIMLPIERAGVQGVAGSNPLAPTRKKDNKRGLH
jgi:hypothetical protein